MPWWCYYFYIVCIRSRHLRLTLLRSPLISFPPQPTVALIRFWFQILIASYNFAFEFLWTPIRCFCNKSRHLWSWQFQRCSTLTAITTLHISDYDADCVVWLWHPLRLMTLTLTMSYDSDVDCTILLSYPRPIWLSRIPR